MDDLKYIKEWQIWFYKTTLDDGNSRIRPYLIVKRKDVLNFVWIPITTKEPNKINETYTFSIFWADTWFNRVWFLNLQKYELIKKENIWNLIWHISKSELYDISNIIWKTFILWESNKDIEKQTQYLTTINKTINNYYKNINNTFLQDIVDASYIIMQKKQIIQSFSEDNINWEYRDLLRGKNHDVNDQPYSWKSFKWKTQWKLDLVLYNNWKNIESIIECLILKTCWKKETYLKNHIDKLINSYDTLGNLNNYIITYSKSPNFGWLCNSYIDRLKSYFPIFNWKTNTDVTNSYSNKTDIKIYLTKYMRNWLERNLYHIIINLYV